MGQSKYITVELNLKFQCQDYRLVLGVGRLWIVTIVVVGARLTAWYFGYGQ